MNASPSQTILERLAAVDHEQWPKRRRSAADDPFAAAESVAARCGRRNRVVRPATLTFLAGPELARAVPTAVQS